MSDTNSKARMEVMQGVASGLGFWGHMTGASGQRLFDAAQQLCREGKALMSQINDGGLSDYRYIVYAPDERFDRQELSVVKASPGVTPGESKVTPDMLTAIERMAFDAYREGYMAGNEVSVTYEYESRVAHAEGRAVRYVEARLERFTALSTRVRELEAALPTAHELQRAVDTMGSIIKNPSGHDRWLEDLVPIRNWLRALLPQVPTNVGDGK